MRASQRGRTRWVRTRLSAEIIEEKVHEEVASGEKVRGPSSSYAGWILKDLYDKGHPSLVQITENPSLKSRDEDNAVIDSSKEANKSEAVTSLTSISLPWSPKKHLYSPRDFDSCCDASDFGSSVLSYETQDTVQSKMLLTKLEQVEHEKEFLVSALGELERSISASVAKLEMQTKVALKRYKADSSSEQHNEKEPRKPEMSTSLELLRRNLEVLNDDVEWEEMKNAVQGILQEAERKRVERNNSMNVKGVGKCMMLRDKFSSSCRSQNPMEECLSPSDSKYEFLIDS
eukprot:746270-Hanusia_phi.AAC.2